MLTEKVIFTTMSCLFSNVLVVQILKLHSAGIYSEENPLIK